MSFYATIEGQITYQTPQAFDAALALLEKGGWVKDGEFRDEAGAVMRDAEDDGPCVDREHLILTIPCGLHRNLATVLDQLFHGGTGQVIATSTDGVFTGWVFVDGLETAYDLDAWGREHVGPVPDPDDFEAHCRWQAEVESRFHEQFGE